VSLEGAAEGRSRLWRIENGLDKAPLILHREPDDFRGLNCLTRGFVGGSDHEIADAAALDFGGAFDNVEHVWRDTRLNPCGAVSRSGHHGTSLSVFNVRYLTGQTQVGHSKWFGHFDDFFIADAQWEVLREWFFLRAGLPQDPAEVSLYLHRRLNEAYDRFAQAFQVELVIVVCLEAGLTIIAALDNMLGNRRYTQPWETGHLQILLLY
jgi:hypothetical protein